MNKRKVSEIVKFNIEKNIQNKWFVILNILICLVTIIAVNFKNIGNFLESNNINIFEEELTIEVLDDNGIAFGRFEKEFEKSKSIEIKYVTENNYTKENIGDDVVLVEYQKDEDNNLITKVVSKEAVDDFVYDKIMNITKEIRNEIFSAKFGITTDEIKKLSEDPKIEKVMLGVDAENSDQKQMVKTISVMVVYFVLIFVLSRIANEIVTEKISKSTEYVLTSVTAKEYLLAKVLSVTLTILIQLLYTFIYYIIAMCINFGVNTGGITNVQKIGSNIDTSIISYVFVMGAYLVFTTFFMSMIQAAISSKSTSVSEASNTTMFLLMFVIILYCISLSAINPYIKVSTFMYVVSCIPIVSTFFIPSMMIIGQATTIQIVISFIALIAFTPFLFNKCSKIFKNGILDYTDKNKKNKKLKKQKSIKEEQEELVLSKEISRFSFVIGFSILLWFILQQIGNLFLLDMLKGIFKDALTEKSILWIYMAISSAFSLWCASKIISGYTPSEYKKYKKTDFKTALKVILMGIGFVTIIQYLEIFISDKFGMDYQIISNDMLVNASGTVLEKILFVIGIAVIPGIFEELLVRKSVLSYGKKFGNIFTLLLSAFIFGLIHMNLKQGIFAFGIGIVFGIIMLKTFDIRLTMILHILNNGFVAIETIFANNEMFINVLDIIVIILAVLGILLFVGEMLKNKGLKIEKDFSKNRVKMLFKNYTFDLMIIMFIILTVVTENYLRLL